MSAGRLGLLVGIVECYAFSIAHAAAAGGWDVIVIAPPGAATASEQNRKYTARLRQLPNVRVVETLEDVDLDVLRVDLLALPQREWVDHFARRAKSLGMITYVNRDSTMRTFLAEVKELNRVGMRFLTAKHVSYMDGYRPFDLYGLFATRSHVGIDVYSTFLLDPQLRDAMFADDWTIERKRKHKLNFVGNEQPAARAEILKQVTTAIESSGKTIARTPNDLKDDTDIVWFVGGGLDQLSFARLLGDCDFTLCPPGHVRLTHRVIEALIRGSVPILNADELPLYDIGLEDGVNCLAAPRGQWVDVTQRALSMSDRGLQFLRNKILAMRPKYLTIDASNRRFRKSLGLEMTA